MQVLSSGAAARYLVAVSSILGPSTHLYFETFHKTCHW